ncbi:MAG: hypothetical protein ACOX5W_11095 [Bacillota bacterium]
MNTIDQNKAEDLPGNRIIEAYVGEYASGKSENAVNRALDLADKGRKVTLVDLDTVEPCYTLRPLKGPLSELGIDVIAWETKQLIGLGEAGMVLHPHIPLVLHRQGDIILDVGYGVGGARTLNLVEGAQTSQDLRVLVVINVSRPMTSTLEDIVEYIRGIGRVDGIINNSHLGTETDLEIIQRGVYLVTEAAHKLGLPVEATVVEERWREVIGPIDCLGNPVRFLRKRFMADSFW